MISQMKHAKGLKNLLFPAFVILYILPKVMCGDREHESILRRSQKPYELPGRRNMFLSFVEIQPERRTLSKSVPSHSVSSRSPSRKSPNCGLASTKGVQTRARRYIHPTFCFISDWSVANVRITMGRDGTHVRLSNLASSSSLRNCTSSKMSSSDHLRVARFFTNGRS